MIKVIHIVDTLNAGGAERVAVDITNGLSEEGVQVFFCTTRQTGLLQSALNKNVPIINLNRKKSYNGLFRLRQYILSNKINIVHAHGNSTALFCIVALLMSNVKIIHHDHNSLLNQRNVYLQRLMLTRVAAWITVSEKIFCWVYETVKYKEVILMINPIRLVRFSKGLTINAVKRIIMIANYRVEKDYENLIKAISILKGSQIEFVVNCFGFHSDGDYYKKIEALIAFYGIGHLIKLNPSSSNIHELLNQSDIGILTSASEGLPISLLEYMASSLPIIVTDVGECGRIVRESNCGLVVPSEDAILLSKAIDTVLRDKENWAEWGKNGRSYVIQNHSFDSYLKKLIQEVYFRL
jgi:glycosyltransferase involved in cell wall biosynthesis